LIIYKPNLIYSPKPYKIMRKRKLLLVAVLLLPQILFSSLTFAQAKLIQGKVTDERNDPIVGANVYIAGTTIGTSTGVNGEFSIEATPETTLTISFIGYLTETIQVGNQTNIDVRLMPDMLLLADVVIIGYGTQTRGNLTGSISTISAQTLESKPVSSLESALQGEVPGVSVVSSGGPGQSPTVRIRGIGSVNFSADPLYVIDGIPVGNLNNFDVNDIESVSILKDAAAASIYGSRAANGVVLITTKKGKRDGRISVNLNTSTGFQQAWRKLDLMNSDEYRSFANQLLTNAGLPLPARFSGMNEPIYAGATQTYAQTETNWQNEMFRTAPISQINVDLSGGNERSRFYTSYGRFQQEGIMLGTDFNRHNFRINSEYNITDYLTIGESFKGSYSQMSNEVESSGRTIIKHMVNQVPYIPVEDPTLLGGYRSANANDGTDPENPVRIALQDRNETNTVNVLGSAFAQLSFTDWLSFRSSIGFEYTGNRNIGRNPMFSDSYNQRNFNELSDDRSIYYSRIFTNQLNFDRSFGSHDINVVAVVEEQVTNFSFLNANGNHTTNSLQQLQGTSSQTINGGLDETALISYVGRVNYAYDDKYLMSASFRRDGSSVFAPGKKWGNFPGASIGWVVSRENFMQNVDIISDLKLRASYGTLGFNAVGAYPWQSTIAFNTWAVFNNNAANNAGAFFDVLPNRDLEWEITRMTNFGFDLSMLNQSVIFSAEYYVREVDNLIVENPLAFSTGYAVDPLTNIGEMRNWGYDFTAGYRKFTGDFQFSATANLSTVNNEVVRLSTGSPFIDRSAVTGDYGGGAITRTQAGHPIQGFYGYVVEGIFQDQTEIDALNAAALAAFNAGLTDQAYYQNEFTSPGDIKFRDRNGDGVIDDRDREIIGNFLPDFTYGLNLRAEYRNFDVSLLFQGVYGNEIYNGTKVLTQGMMRLFNGDRAVLDAWTPENRNTDIPRAISGDPNNNARTSDRFIEDGSYMRIKNLTIGYSFDNIISSTMIGNTISGLRVYFTAQNLLTITNYTGYDPEIASRENNTLLHGADFGQYPQPRTFMLGIRASF
jgi:TonB-dependent starch-binding outer membrane protein SusC